VHVLEERTTQRRAFHSGHSHGLLTVPPTIKGKKKDGGYPSLLSARISGRAGQEPAARNSGKRQIDDMGGRKCTTGKGSRGRYKKNRETNSKRHDHGEETR
jgi:hypothetical protein